MPLAALDLPPPRPFTRSARWQTFTLPPPPQTAPKKSVYKRRGLLHPDEPAECPTHGRTVRRCIRCKRVTCWKCVGEPKPHFHFEDICVTCELRVELWLTQAEVYNRVLAETVLQASIARRAGLQAYVGREATIAGICSTLSVFQQWCLQRQIVVLPFMPSAPTLCAYIVACIDGDDRRRPVAFGTVQKLQWALNIWRRYYEHLHRCNLPDPFDDLDVQQAFKLAKLCCYVPGLRKPPVDGEQGLRLFIEHRLRQHDFWLVMQGLIALVAARSLIRKQIQFDVPYTQGANIPVVATDYALAQNDSRFLLALDDKGRLGARIIGTAEKNAQLKAKSTRWINDSPIDGVRGASTMQAFLDKLDMPSGYLCRRSRFSTTPLTASDWEDFLRAYADFTGHPRDQLGHNSFRRYFACKLHASGCSAEEIRTLGYWWSDAAREYLASMRAARIDILDRAAAHA